MARTDEQERNVRLFWKQIGLWTDSYWVKKLSLIKDDRARFRTAAKVWWSITAYNDGNDVYPQIKGMCQSWIRQSDESTDEEAERELRQGLSTIGFPEILIDEMCVMKSRTAKIERTAKNTN